ncbi:DEBR0S3_08174g1_1 [Brettanomyces bruxellensis]|uniref:DEBR0S3_08174g1_1 n=1 Tax=Dekkera bruxellensis TaxID=5007 RepID=A0A7D9CYW5_DEKBR|nr:DEBR0S3_08174g1_1 [Brettanomyces bruxellensis]
MIWLRKLTFYEKVVIIQFVSLLLAFAFQLLAVLTVPITNLTLSNYEGYRFGVFGLCDDSGCSIGQIGYSPYSVNRRLKGFAFPSNARHSMSYLLVVHPISTAFTGVQLILTALLFFNTRFSSSGYYVFLQLWSLPTFLLALLSFLTDLLMFIPHLTWCGWVLLASACCIALNGTLLCVLRRAAYSRIARQYTKNFSRNEIDLSAVDLVPQSQTIIYWKTSRTLRIANLSPITLLIIRQPKLSVFLQCPTLKQFGPILRHMIVC